jgi:hypothetical protein
MSLVEGGVLKGFVRFGSAEGNDEEFKKRLVTTVGRKGEEYIPYLCALKVRLKEFWRPAELRLHMFNHIVLIEGVKTQ